VLELAKISASEHLLTIEDFFIEEDKDFYIFMDYCSGGTIEDALLKGYESR